MIVGLRFSNYLSFKEDTAFSMEATASQAKGDNVFVCSLNNSEQLRLLKSSVIYGANASGKTNIIKRLFYLVQELRTPSGTFGGDEIDYLHAPFSLDEDSKTKPSEVKIEFIAEGMRYIYKVKTSSSEILEEGLYYFPNGYQATLYERERIDSTTHCPKYVTTQSDSNKPKFNVFSNRLILSKFLYDTPDKLISPAARYLARINFANGYNSVMRRILWSDNYKWLSSSNHRELLAKLLHYADLGVSDFDINNETKNLNDVVLHHSVGEDKVYPICYSDESLGTRQLFLIGAKILQSLEEGIPLLIDEIDSGFHTYLSEFIIDLFTSPRSNRKNAQLIITSHEINLMNEDRLRRDQVWSTSKNEKGESELYSLADFEGVRENTPFAKWYMANKFGGLPNIRHIEDLFGDEA